MHLMPTQETIRFLKDLIFGGLGVALFAWMFDTIRRSLFAGMGRALKASLHGWANFSLAMTENDIARMKLAIHRPSIPIAGLIVGVFAAILGFLLFISVLILNFIDTYNAINFKTPPSIFSSIIPSAAIMIFSAIFFYLGFYLIATEFSRILFAESKLEKLTERKLKLETQAAARTVSGA